MDGLCLAGFKELGVPNVGLSVLLYQDEGTPESPF